MTKDEVIRLAKEVGAISVTWCGPDQLALVSNDKIERFAALIEQAEREECAKLCDALQDYPDGAVPNDCAIVIRSRNDTEAL